MGKKIALGCLGVTLLLVIGGGFIGYQYFVKPMMSGISSLQNIHELNTQIEDRSTYTPPADDELRKNQVDRFVAAQQDMHSALEERLTELQKKYESMEGEWENREPSVREMMNAWEDIIETYTDAKEIQINTLNEHGFSLEEYRYVQQSFYQALGVELFSYNIDEIAKAASEGNFDMNLEQFEEAQTQMDQVPERNRELAAPYADDAEIWATFAWFGL